MGTKKPYLTGFDNMQFGLVGERLSHSYSPLIHSYFADYGYTLHEVSPDDLPAFVTNTGLSGFNVTVPYKQAVMRFCDEISQQAQMCSAVNTVIRRPDGSLFGDNTDSYGFLQTLKQTRTDPGGKKTVILGSGGAAGTVRSVLKSLGAEQIVCVSRHGDDNYGNLCRHYDAQIIVNATPVGMYPDCSGSLVDLEHFKSCECVIDLIYNPAKTGLLLGAGRLGIPCANGLMMLCAQAKRASELFVVGSISDSYMQSVYKSVRRKMCNIVLVGMPGCGKTTVGRLLADILGRPFADIDDMVTESCGKTPAEIIVSDGEQSFRRHETNQLDLACSRSGQVIACGGGAVTVPENLDILRRNSTVIFLDRNKELLCTESRPLSADLNALYASRIGLYRQFSDYTVNANGSAQSVADAIAQEYTKGKIL